MSSLNEYKGRLLNHVEVLYPKGERDVAIKLFETLGYTVHAKDTSPYTLVFPESAELDRQNNVMYLSEVRDLQWELEQIIQDRVKNDDELREAIEAYDHKARTAPHGIPHFGIRYPSFADINEVIDRLEHDLPTELEGRVSVDAVRPDDPRCMNADLIQAFVRTDVVCAGLFPFGQLIELQGQRAPSEAA